MGPQRGFRVRRYSAVPAGRRFQAEILDPAAHVAAMDQRGIDVEVVSSSTVNAGCEWAGPRTDLALNQRLNDADAQAQQAHSGRVLGSITLPLQAPGLGTPGARRAGRGRRLRRTLPGPLPRTGHCRQGLDRSPAAGTR
ncbi:hypothetical protein [Streptomyces boncukensis]|uniref:Uncharacterized protein n=1 Tax=Streptomyces boncukensis TaxID=2711219 RepID=A0A6G4WSI9_9ACTN|nr:hypothetical protein [Streptomyces boncukensis]NGO68165.1 hypothetical protein [Streptomyces boncukensis]